MYGMGGDRGWVTCGLSHGLNSRLKRGSDDASKEWLDLFHHR